jgi:hypothetical protein
MARNIIVGDIHGCLEELEELLTIIKLESTDHLVLIGDLIDRGPDAPGVVKKCAQLSQCCAVTLILGNHEEKLLRYLKHLRRKTGIEQQMKGTEEFPQLIQALTEEEHAFLENAYYSYQFEGLTLVHGGVSKRLKFPFPATYKVDTHAPKDYPGLDLLTKIRYLNPDGNFVSLNEEGPEDAYWAEVYDGSYGHVYFGHQPFMQEHPKCFENATGLDTGCVYGGWLSAAIIEGNTRSFISVKAKKTYTKHFSSNI